MAKYVVPKPLQQKLTENIQSAFRGYNYISAINAAIDVNATLNGDALSTLPVAIAHREDICNCLYLAKEYSGEGEVVFRDIVLEFK